MSAIPQTPPAIIQEVHYNITSAALVNAAKEYALAADAYYNTELGRAEVNDKSAFKKAYLKCSASDEAKREALSSLSADTQKKFENSYVFKHQKGVLVLDENGTVTLEQFVAAAEKYENSLAAAKDLPEYAQQLNTVDAFRKMAVEQLKAGNASTVAAQMKKDLANGGLISERALSRPEYWAKKYF